MRAEIDTSAVFARYPDASPTERFAEVDRERRRQLDEICRPVPGSRELRRRKFGYRPGRVGRDPRPVGLYFPAEMFAELGREAIRRGLSTSALVREAWALAKSELRAMPAKRRTDLRKGERSGPAERLAFRLRFADEFDLEAAASQMPNSPRAYVYKVLSRAVSAGLLVRLGMGRYRPTEKAQTLRGAA